MKLTKSTARVVPRITLARIGEVYADQKKVENRNLRRGVINKSLGTFGNRGTKTFFIFNQLELGVIR